MMILKKVCEVEVKCCSAETAASMVLTAREDNCNVFQERIAYSCMQYIMERGADRHVARTP